MTPHICVVGAGVSGLRCATVLLENSYEVTIIEGRNRIGGRITQSDQMGPLEVDLGANWVHSTGFNPIVELARETGTPLHRWKESTQLIDGEGSPLAKSEANKALEQVWEILEEAIDYSKHNSEQIDSAASLYTFFETWCDRALESGSLTGREAELVLGMSQMWGAYVEDCFIPTNYKKIMALIAAVPLARAHFQWNTTMTSIEALTDGGSSVGLTTSDGKKQYFDGVVVTVPLGWLKQHKQCIKPLHPRIASAIESISYGRLEKVLIEFPTAFWEPVDSGAGNGNEEDTSFVHWLSPLYTTQTNPQRWRLECVSFHAFPQPYRRNILLFYTFGDCSSYTTASIHGLQGKARDQWLQDFFEPYYSRLPGYTTACAPLRFLATEWCNDEFAGNGSYSNFQVGMTDAAHDVEAIRHGMPDQHIYFAGEHTAPFDGLGTVAGAYTSGEKVARRIVEGRQPTN
ncbi:MAG: hypothetical protein Q9208_007862 [Pyrenodesmia sp. 3 TL-2023]